MRRSKKRERFGEGKLIMICMNDDGEVLDKVVCLAPETELPPPVREMIYYKPKHDFYSELFITEKEVTIKRYNKKITF